LNANLGVPMNNAGTWWLKGAWLELGIERALVDVIEAAVQRYQAEAGSPLRMLTHSREVLVRKNETLAFLPLFEDMTRLIHLDTYDDEGLGWLVEAPHVYRSETMESYLTELTHLKMAHPLGQALADCYWRAWYEPGRIPDRHVFYVDMHDKVIWTGKPSPVGFVSALHEVRACLKQAFVHGHGGHTLFGQTYAADVHLSEVVVQVALALEQAVRGEIIQVIVTDREGLAAEVIQALTRHNKALVALLKANQYSDEADFVRQGRFRQIKDPRTGEVTHRVADADFQLTPDLAVRAALIYDLAHPDVLIALITTVSREKEPDIRRIVRWYLERWNAQENSFRDQIAFVHLNINFGLRAKRVVPDRRVAQQIASLTTHLAAVTRKQENKLSQLADLERRLQDHMTRHDQKIADLLRPSKRQGAQAAARAAKRERRLQGYRQRYHQRLSKQLIRRSKLEYEIEVHRQEQARVTDELTQLDPQAKFFEVDTEKDQIMAHVRIGLHNSALWARDCYFSSTYRHATPLTLWRTFFNQDGFYRETDDGILVTLKPFRTPRTQREAFKACQRFNARQVKTLSGKTIEMHVVESI
jgi:TusA-related sulfurtransferase